MATVTLHASADYGRTGQYIAILTGRAPKVHFERSFVGSKYGKRNESTSYETDEAGLYECCDQTRKGKVKRYYIVLEYNDELVKVRTDLGDSLVIAKRIGEGESLADVVELSTEETRGVVYEIKSKAEVKKTKAAGDIYAAVEAVVAALQALPTNLQKKAIAQAKERLFPPTPKPTAQPESESTCL
jgi:hypothetical protein